MYDSAACSSGLRHTESAKEEAAAAISPMCDVLQQQQQPNGQNHAISLQLAAFSSSSLPNVYVSDQKRVQDTSQNHQRDKSETILIVCFMTQGMRSAGRTASDESSGHEMWQLLSSEHGKSNPIRRSSSLQRTIVVRVSFLALESDVFVSDPWSRRHATRCIRAMTHCSQTSPQLWFAIAVRRVKGNLATSLPTVCRSSSTTSTF